MFTMKSEMVGPLWWVMIVFKVLTKDCLKDGVSDFRNLHANFHNFVCCSVRDYHG
jgi:hypothetical protein